jgi:glutamine amidotransferase
VTEPSAPDAGSAPGLRLRARRAAPRVTIVDYGIGNLGSVLNMLKHVGVPAAISADPTVLSAAEKLILPGVGAFDTAARRLRESGLLDILHQKVIEQRTPTLGLCLGMQLLTRGSEEGEEIGLGWIAGETRRFRFPDGAAPLRIPHMGWNTVTPRPGAALFAGLQQEARFYFVHGYHVMLDEPDDVAGVTRYGYEFVSAVQRGTVFGTQFHPEKSHRFGMRLLKTFADLPVS